MKTVEGPAIETASVESKAAATTIKSPESRAPTDSKAPTLTGKSQDSKSPERIKSLEPPARKDYGLSKNSFGNFKDPTLHAEMYA